jgi:hypothetical protein
MNKNYLPLINYEKLLKNGEIDDVIEAMRLLDSNSHKMNDNDYLLISNYLMRIYLKIKKNKKKLIIYIFITLLIFYKNH